MTHERPARAPKPRRSTISFRPEARSLAQGRKLTANASEVFTPGEPFTLSR